MTTTLDAPPVSPLPVPKVVRWQPLRAGLQDIWQYDHTTRFVFHHGRLLLRGRNGAGKTKVVEVLLPFLLEGRLQPSRLDPFGTRSRKMHYNILPPDRDTASAIGYAWMEFGRRDDDGLERYTTIGAGLKARRSSDQVESWFFVVDDRRVDVDLDLLDGDRRPLSRPALTEAIGDDGAVFETSRDYRAAVNKALFGAEPDQYEALVEALLRLRQPHLSERLNPEEVGAVLSDSLPPLDVDRVREVAEGFDRLEAHRHDLDDRRRTLAAVEQFLGDYRSYAGTVAGVRARALTRADSAVRAASERVTASEQANADAVADEADVQERLAITERDLEAARTRIHTLETSDEYRAVQQLEEAEQRVEHDQQLVERAERRHAAAEEAYTKAGAARQQAADTKANRREAADQAQRDAAVAAATAELRGEHATIASLVPLEAPGDTTAAAGTLRSVYETRCGAINAVQRTVDALRAAQDDETTARRHLDDTRAGVDDRRDRLTAAEEVEAAAVAAHRDQVTAWATDCTVLHLNDGDAEGLLDRDPTEAAAAARQLAVPHRDHLDRSVGDADAALRDAAERLAAVEAEHDTLAAATHEPPPAPGWRQADRTARSGAPLYLLVEPTDALAAAAQANVEAALHAAGLLDAWVTVDGALLDPDTLDAVAVPVGPVVGRSLADVARPTPDGDVAPEVVEGILRSVALLDADTIPPVNEGSHWVATDGRFRLGPLHGAARGDVVRYLGETARRRARDRRLAELAATIERLRTDRDEAARVLAVARDRRVRLDEELDAFPSVQAVLRARAAVAEAVAQLDDATAQLQVADEQLAAAVETRRQAEAARNAAADEHGLAAHVDRLDELELATDGWHTSARDWLHAADRLLDASQRLADLQAALDQAASALTAVEDELGSARREHARATERVRTLREAVGSTRDELLAQLATTREEEAALAASIRGLHDRQVEVARRVGAADIERATAVEVHEAAQQDREQAARDVRVLASLGVLHQVVADPPTDEPDTWSVRATLEVARQVTKQVRELPDDPDAVRKQLSDAHNRLARRQQELLRDLVAGIRLFPADHGGVIVYEAQHQGRTYRLDGLVDELREDVTERDARLHHDEQELLEAFLAGELHEHLRARIRDATDLVEAMNEQLAVCRTATGQQLRLRWQVGDDAPPATEQAVELLLRGSGLLTEDQRGQLRTYLHERLREAREGEAAVSLFDRIATAFDYREWHRFTIEFRAAGGSWRRLTRTTHGTGSGGEKAVMLHLPLFAAMAAHYHSLPTAPRLIVLDEVFAGIDRGTRGQLMGLLVELDLDALLTSHEEWGFYRELDGLSTYHLVREPDIPGVLAEWFVWDGANRWEMTPA